MYNFSKTYAFVCPGQTKRWKTKKSTGIRKEGAINFLYSELDSYFYKKIVAKIIIPARFFHRTKRNGSTRIKKGGGDKYSLFRP